jgi:hypothetical protein
MHNKNILYQLRLFRVLENKRANTKNKIRDKKYYQIKKLIFYKYLKMKYILLSIILCILTSCSFFIKKSSGIKNPKMETYQSINKYSQIYDIDSSLIVFSKDSTKYIELNKLFTGNPEILIFDQNKHFYPYKNEKLSCNATINYTLENICKTYSVFFNDTRKINYDTLISCLADPNHCISSFSLKQFDYIVFICFAKYTDGINKTHLIPWNKTIKESKNNCRVKYIYVDLDYLDTWGISNNSLPKIRIKLF